MRFFPITAKLNVFAGAQTWVYLMYSTALARLATGLARVYQNRPSAQDPSLSEAEKRQACIERFFVEIFGTLSYLLFLHLGQDVTAKFLEPKLKASLNDLVSRIESPTSGLTAKQALKAKTALTSIYGDSSSHFIDRYLYGSKNGLRANLANMKAHMKDDALFHYVRSSVPLDTFTSMLRRRAALSVFGGVAASAIFGGLVTQWLNDRLFAPAVRRALEKRYNTPAPNTVSPTQGVSGPKTAPTINPMGASVATAAPTVSTTPTTSFYSQPSFYNATSPYTKPSPNYSMPMPGVWSNTLGGLPR